LNYLRNMSLSLKKEHENKMQNNMYEKSNTLKEIEKEQKKYSKYYEWRTGDKMGEIVEFSHTEIGDDGNEYLVFKNNERANSSVVGQFIIEVDEFYAMDILSMNREKELLKEKNKIENQKSIDNSEKINPLYNSIFSLLKCEEQLFNIDVKLLLPSLGALQFILQNFNITEEDTKNFIKSKIENQLKNIVDILYDKYMNL